MNISITYISGFFSSKKILRNYFSIIYNKKWVQNFSRAKIKNMAAEIANLFIANQTKQNIIIKCWFSSYFSKNFGPVKGMGRVGIIKKYESKYLLVSYIHTVEISDLVWVLK